MVGPGQVSPSFIKCLMRGQTEWRQQAGWTAAGGQTGRWHEPLHLFLLFPSYWNCPWRWQSPAGLRWPGCWSRAGTVRLERRLPDSWPERSRFQNSPLRPGPTWFRLYWPTGRRSPPEHTRKGCSNIDPSGHVKNVSFLILNLRPKNTEVFYCVFIASQMETLEVKTSPWSSSLLSSTVLQIFLRWGQKTLFKPHLTGVFPSLSQAGAQHVARDRTVRFFAVAVGHDGNVHLLQRVRNRTWTREQTGKLTKTWKSKMLAAAKCYLKVALC